MRQRRVRFLLLAALGLAGCAAARTPSGGGTAGGVQAEESGEALRQRRLVARVLRDFRESLEGASARRVMETTDEGMTDAARFEDQVTALLRGTLERRVFFRESSWEIKGNHASVMVDAELVLTARNRARSETRRRERVQFDFVRGNKGWKISEISPRSVFAW